jgi:transposase
MHATNLDTTEFIIKLFFVKEKKKKYSIKKKKNYSKEKKKKKKKIYFEREKKKKNGSKEKNRKKKKIFLFIHFLLGIFMPNLKANQMTCHSGKYYPLIHKISFIMEI